MIWQSRGDSAHRSGASVGNCSSYSNARPQCAHLEYGLSLHSLSPFFPSKKPRKGLLGGSLVNLDVLASFFLGGGRVES